MLYRDRTNHRLSHGLTAGLYTASELMKIAGLNAYAYRGAHGQSLQTATRYYACFAKYAGFTKVITAENSGKCPDAQQYFGVVVNGVGENALIGAYRFPDDDELIALDGARKGRVREVGPFAGADPVR